MSDLIQRLADALDSEHESREMVLGRGHREPCKTCALIVEAREAKPPEAHAGAGEPHTPGPWMVRCIRDNPEDPPTVETMKRVLCEGIDRTIAYGDADTDLWSVLSSLDEKDPVFICYTGNGPTSEANARFIASLVARPAPAEGLRDLLERATTWIGDAHEDCGGGCEAMKLVDEINRFLSADLDAALRVEG